MAALHLFEATLGMAPPGVTRACAVVSYTMSGIARRGLDVTESLDRRARFAQHSSYPLVARRRGFPKQLLLMRRGELNDVGARGLERSGDPVGATNVPHEIGAGGREDFAGVGVHPSCD